MTRIAFDAETIQALAATAAQWGLTEIELRDGDSHLRISRAAVVAAPAAAPQPAAAAAMAPEPAAPADEAPLPAGAVTSPMVGIAYLCAEPGAPQFVSVGQQVAAGQTVLLIEAMKTFNQVKAPAAGTVTRILVTNGQPVEYGQPLLVIA